MNWYKSIIADLDTSIVDLAYDEWKKSSFEANVNSIIYRIHQIGLPADVNEKKIDKKIMPVLRELASQDGEMQLWHKVIEDRLYLSKIKNAVKKLYKKRIKELEKAQNGPLQINTPQTPSGGGAGGGGAGGGMLM